MNHLSSSSSSSFSSSSSSSSFSLQFDLTQQEPAPPPPTVGSGIMETGVEFDPLESPPSRDFFPDYLVTVIVPLVLAIILCVLLAYVMFCRREGVYVKLNNDPQCCLLNTHISF